MPYLCVETSGGGTLRYNLGLERISIGRSSKNDLVLPDLTVSRSHAAISRRGDLYFIEDLGSRRGTIVNRRPISAPVRLEEGDEIHLGQCRAIFSIAGDFSAADSMTGTHPVGPAGAPQVPCRGTVEIRRDLDIARDIQRFLLPARPEIRGYRILGDSQPCFEVGGDFYDFGVRPDGQVTLLVGDVAGKGVAAALLGHYTQALIRTALAYEPALDRFTMGSEPEDDATLVLLQRTEEAP